MVDFNNEATIGTPAIDVVRILVLQRRADLFDAIERYHKLMYQGTAPDTSIVRARLVTLFLELQASLKRRFKDKKNGYEDIRHKVYSQNPEKTFEAVYYLNEYLDETRLTRLDNKPQYDKTKWEAGNRAHNY